MKKNAAMLCLLTVACAGSVLAAEGPVPKGVPHLDHVFVVMMENHGYSQIVNNPNAPFVNKLAQSANSAANYFAVAHPSLTNYLEVVGGSNFGIHADQYPDWHNPACTPNLATGMTSTDSPSTGPICPIAGSGTDAATPALDPTTNETNTPPLTNIDGTLSFPADPNISGKTIADQLVASGRSWKTYQEGLPIGGPDRVNTSDGFYTNLTDFTKIMPVLTPPLTSASLVFLYAVKHNPFVYFANVQGGDDPRLSFKRVASFEGIDGFYADLASGNVPEFSFIAPNQCNDQHGRGNAGAFCNYDPSSDGTQAGLNPALIQRGDLEVQRLVTSIQASPVWKEGRNAIVILWDENDYSTAPNTNQVLLIVVPNHHGEHGVQSSKFYTHFSLLKSLEAGFELPCLNHACDSSVSVMSDLFGRED